MKTFLIAALTILANSVYATAEPVREVTAADLVGVWKLVKSENPMPDGTTVTYCNGVHGYIIYTAEGYVSVSLNCGPQLTAVEPANISGRKFFYTGTYNMIGQDVVHHLENASDVQLIGTDSRRTVTLTGNQLVLSGVNQGQTFSATWQKIN